MNGYNVNQLKHTQLLKYFFIATKPNATILRMKLKQHGK